MADYIQGEIITLFVSFFDGLSAPIRTGISDTNVTMYHMAGGVPNFNILSGAMIQQAPPVDNVWYYSYGLANNAATTTYNVIYDAIFSGSNIQTSEVFNVLPASSSFPNPYGQGSVAISGTVVNTSGIGINYASVVMSSGQFTFASTTTDASGNYLAYLNPGNYMFNFFANNYYPTQTMQSIPSGTIWNIGTQVLQSAVQGNVTISDTFAYQSPNNVICYLPNLKVSLYSKLADADTPPYGIAYTNMSGTFVMNAEVGLYTMSVQGEYFNQNTNKNDRYNYTYDIEVNPVWSGSGPNGSSTPMNFQYNDTSKYSYT